MPGMADDVTGGASGLFEQPCALWKQTLPFAENRRTLEKTRMNDRSDIDNVGNIVGTHRAPAGSSAFHGNRLATAGVVEEPVHHIGIDQTQRLMPEHLRQGADDLETELLP